MNRNKYSINLSGMRVTSKETPYIIMGEPVKEADEMCQLRMQVPENIKSYDKLGYATSIETISLIFTHKTIRSSNLSSAKLNDKMEKQRVGVSQFASGRFITCFTHNHHESIPFWAYYGGSDKTKKVQLQFKNFAVSFNDYIYTDYALVAGGKKAFFCSDEYNRTINNNGIIGQQLGLPPINVDFDIRNCIRVISMFDVEYVPAESSIFKEDFSSTTSISFGKDDERENEISDLKMYKPGVLGRQKSNPWDYELETRIMSILKDQEFSAWEYIDLRLKDEVFRDLIIVLSPWIGEAHEEEVKRIINDSALSIDIKESIKIVNSVVEGTLNL